MQASQSPTLVPLAFAANGTKNTIPEASQISITPGAASLNDGFPPLTFTPVAAGGIPPQGADFNGILNLITASIRWQHAGGQFKWNSAFATDTNVGGYPAGAVLERADGAGFWLNLADNNTTNPDATDGSAANWAPLEGYGITAVTGLTNANVTLTPPQFGLPIITLAGTLTGNVQIIFPALKAQWLIINNTTGNFTLTCKTSVGTGVAVPQGGSAQVYGDGTNINQAIATAGRLLRTTVYSRVAGVQNVSVDGAANTTTGATTFIAHPSANKWKVRIWGGGSGAPGCPSTGSNVSASCGGTGGAYGEGLYTSGFSSPLAVTVGLKGNGGGAGLTSSTAGGTSSVGAVITAPGGPAISPTAASAAPLLVGGAVPSSAPTGANVVSAPGQGGGVGQVVNGVGVGGQGGSSGSGNAGPTGGSGSGGLSASSPGAGGAGSAQPNASSGALAGGNGMDGEIIIEEFA